jgi:hypothetical protein
VVHVVGEVGIEVAERVVAQRGEVHHRVGRHVGDVLGRHVAQVHPQRRHRFGDRPEGAGREVADVQTDHVVAGRTEQGNEDAAEVTLMAGHEYTHSTPPRSTPGDT